MIKNLRLIFLYRKYQPEILLFVLNVADSSANDYVDNLVGDNDDLLDALSFEPFG